MTPEQLAILEKGKQRLAEEDALIKGQEKIAEQPYSGFRSFATSASDAASFGFGDELAAKIDELRGKGSYQDRLGYHRANLARAQEDMVPSILGGLTGGAAIGGAGAGILSMAAQAPKIGSVLNAGAKIAAARPAVTSGAIGAGGANIYASGSATEANPYDAIDAAMATTLGGGLGILGSNIGGAISKIGGKSGANIQGSAGAGQGIPVNTSATSGLPRTTKTTGLPATIKGELVPLTKGQATGSSKLLRSENQAIQGILGPEREAAMRDLTQQQSAQVKSILGGSNDVFTPVDDITGILNKEFGAAKQATKQAYERARDLSKGTHLVQGELKPLAQRIDEAIAPFKSNIKVGNAKTTEASLMDFKNITSKKTVPLSDLYALRSNLTRATKDAISTDKAASIELLRVYDDFMKNELSNALKNGSDDMIKAHYDAISKNADMAKRFFDNKSIKEMVTNENLTPEQVGRAIFGSASATTKVDSGAIAKDLIKAAGDNGQAVKDSLKASLMTRLINKGFKDETLKAGTLKTTIDKTLKENPTFVKEVLSPDDISQLQALSRDLGKIEQKYGANVYNSSGSAYELLRTIGRGLRWVPMAGPITGDLLESAGRSISTSGAKGRFDKSIANAMNQALKEFNAGQGVGALVGGQAAAGITAPVTRVTVYPEGDPRNIKGSIVNAY